MEKVKRTIKEKEFIKAYIELKGNATLAYLKVFPYVKKDSATDLGSLLLTKLEISISEMLDLIGLTDHNLSQKLQEGLNATKTIGQGRNKKTIPNHYIRAKYLDIALKLKARYPIDETRLKLPGIDGSTMVTLREIIYSTKDEKGEKKRLSIKRDKQRIARSEENTPF